MNDTVKNIDNTIWISTYGVLTAERLLERFQIKLSREELRDALKNQESPYHHLLTVPLKNIFNGIVIQQIYDYQVYIQKLFIDYKLTSTKVVPENTPTNQDDNHEIEEKYKKLALLSKTFEEKKHEHQQLIAKSQAWLIQQTHESVLKMNNETANQIETFAKQIDLLLLTFKELLPQFRELILETTSVLTLMSDYKFDLEQMEKNKAFLDFDPELLSNRN